MAGERFEEIGAEQPIVLLEKWGEDWSQLADVAMRARRAAPHAPAPSRSSANRAADSAACQRSLSKRNISSALSDSDARSRHVTAPGLLVPPSRSRSARHAAGHAPSPNRAAPYTPRRCRISAISAKEKPAEELQVDELGQRRDRWPRARRALAQLLEPASVAGTSTVASSSFGERDLSAALLRPSVPDVIDDEPAHRARRVFHEAEGDPGTQRSARLFRIK